MYQYFIKVVPSIYTDIRGKVISSNQVSSASGFTVCDCFFSSQLGVATAELSGLSLGRSYHPFLHAHEFILPERSGHQGKATANLV